MLLADGERSGAPLGGASWEVKNSTLQPPEDTWRGLFNSQSNCTEAVRPAGHRGRRTGSHTWQMSWLREKVPENVHGLGNWELGLNSEQSSSLPDRKRNTRAASRGSPGRPQRTGEPGLAAELPAAGGAEHTPPGLGSKAVSPERTRKRSPRGRKKKMGFLLGSEQDPASQRQWLQEPQQLHPC